MLKARGNWLHYFDGLRLLLTWQILELTGQMVIIHDEGTRVDGAVVGVVQYVMFSEELAPHLLMRTMNKYSRCNGCSMTHITFKPLVL